MPERTDIEGEFDPLIGSPSISPVPMSWELDDDDQIEEAVGLLVSQAEEAGFGCRRVARSTSDGSSASAQVLDSG